LLRWRILLGVAFVAALAGLMRLDFVGTPGAWLLPLTILVGLAGAHEIAALLRQGGYRPFPAVIYGGTLLVLASNAVPLFWLPSADDQPLDRLGWPLMAFAMTVMGPFVGEMIRYRQPGGVVVNLALSIFGVAYVGVLLCFAVQLRVLGGPVTGMVALVAMIVVVKLGDVGAYTVGRLFGRHKMAPLLSPGKTWEGAAGAILFACAGAWVTFNYLPGWLGCNKSHHTWNWLIFGLAVAIAGMLGDLAESLLKRDLGVKDSSTWMPGFGGVLDLLDSILFAAPVAYLCILLELT